MPASTPRGSAFLGIHLRLSEGEMALVSDRLRLRGEQRTVATRLLGGASTTELADALGVALDAADREVQRLYDKLDIKTRIELAMLVLKVLSGDTEKPAREIPA